MDNPRRTCLYDLHLQQKARIVDFAGWSLPVQFAGVLAEHEHTRTAASLFDCSHMGQLRITGSDAPDSLSRAVSQDAAALKFGRGKYGFILNESGGVIDDTILMRLAEQDYLLVVNAGTAEKDLAVLSERLTGDVTISPQTGWGKIDLQGPRSCDVLRGVLGDTVAGLRYFDCGLIEVDGAEGILSRTGYTGELGYELFLPPTQAKAVAQKLLDVDPVKPAGLGARDTLRLEMGYPLYGHELGETITPFQASLEFAVDLKRDYVGAEALRARADSIPIRLAGLRTGQRRQPRPGHVVRFAGQKTGTVTSGAFSPSLGEAIALAFIPAELAGTDTAGVIDTGRTEITAQLSALPFYDGGTCRQQTD